MHRMPNPLTRATIVITALQSAATIEAIVAATHKATNRLADEDGEAPHYVATAAMAVIGVIVALAYIAILAWWGPRRSDAAVIVWLPSLDGVVVRHGDDTTDVMTLCHTLRLLCEHSNV